MTMRTLLLTLILCGTAAARADDSARLLRDWQAHPGALTGGTYKLDHQVVLCPAPRYGRIAISGVTFDERSMPEANGISWNEYSDLSRTDFWWVAGLLIDSGFLTVQPLWAWAPPRYLIAPGPIRLCDMR